jgi:hypothetical protein
MNDTRAQFADAIRSAGLHPPEVIEPDGKCRPVPIPDKAAMLEALAAMFDSEDVIELRAFHKGKKRTDAGYFDGEHRQDLANVAARLNAAGAAVYVTLNRIHPQLLGRYCNRVQDYAADAATDANVTRRRWMLIDLDPVRPKDTSASDAQLEAAHERARACAKFLKDQGWLDPIAGQSGNGWHLLYPLDLPNDPESRDLVKGALEGLAAKMDDAVVKVDQAVFNAGRITKLYGTVANKGDHTPLAPWRLSRLVSTPLRGAVVTPEQLRALHSPKAPAQSSMTPTSTEPHRTFDLAGFLSRLGIHYEQDLHEGADRFKLDHCPFNLEHSKGEAAIFQRSTGAIGFKCQHNSCADKTWQDVRTLIDGPKEARRGRQADAGAPAMADGQPDAGNALVGESESHIAYRRVSEIQAKPIRWLWQGRIARGKVSMLAGNPGLGKSQVTVSMAAVVSTGGTWPVDLTPCERGHVIFLSAEDDPADTIRPRLEAAGADLSRVFILDAVVESYLSDGGKVVRAFNLAKDMARLGEMLAEIGNVALIVIDPITAYLGEADSHKNAEIRALLSPLSDLASRHGTAVVCVSHLNKSGGGEALMRVTGSMAFVAAARAAFIVAKDQENEARRLFLPLKNNIGNDQTGLAFAVQSAQVKSAAGLIETSRVMWEAEAVTVTADEAMIQQGDPEERSAVEDARQFLTGLLTDGSISSKQIRADAEGAGYSWRTIQRAQKALGIEAVKEGMKGQWVWRLAGPSGREDRQEPPKNAKQIAWQPSHSSGDVGGLRKPPGGDPEPDAVVI